MSLPLARARMWHQEGYSGRRRVGQAMAAAPSSVTFDTTVAVTGNSMQRYHVGNITAAKSADTRQRRIDRAIAALLRIWSITSAPVVLTGRSSWR
jgi:hypothetical protein